MPGATAWHASNKSKFRTPAEYRSYLFSPERLDARVDIFLTMSLPQLDIAARDWNIRHVVSYSTYLPAKYREMLEGAARKYSWLVLDLCAPGDRPLDPLSLAPLGMVGAYRLDDDDILPTDYFERAAPYLTESHAGMFVSFAAGLTAIYREGQLFFTRRAYVPMIALGLMSIHAKHANGSFDSPPPAAHNLSDRAAPVILDSREPGYMWVRHLDQDTTVHAVGQPREKRLQNLIMNMEERPPATDQEEIARFFPAIVSRIHSGMHSGENLQALISTLALVPKEGLSLALTPISGRVNVTARHRAGAGAVPQNALLAFELTTEDGRSIGPERAEELGALGLIYSRLVGYFKYLHTSPGRSSTSFSFTLPDGVRATTVNVRKWHRPETAIHLEELVLRTTT